MLALKSKRRFAIASGVLAMLIAFGAPLAWNNGLLQSLPLSIKSALTGTSGSLFPILPWSGYIFLGATLGTLYTTAGHSRPVLLQRAIPIGMALIALGVGLEHFSHAVYGDPNFWPTSPHLFLTRIGFVTTVLGLATFVEHFVRTKASTIRSLAEESLLVYFVHVALLYGSMWNPGINNILAARWASPTLTFSCS